MTKPKTESRYRTREMKASDFKAKCLQTMDEVRERGVRVVITKRGKPVATLVPAEGVVRSPIGFMRGTVLAQEDIVSPDHDTWALVDEDLDPGVRKG